MNHPCPHAPSRKPAPAGRLGVLLPACLAAFLLSLSTAGSAQTPPPTPPAPQAAATDAARRDSLLQEVQRYRDLIASLRDSLGTALPGSASGEKRREAFDQALEEFGGVISNIGRELSNLDLSIEDQTISLSDREGGKVQITIPPDLGEQISEGISSITTAILKDLPDTVSWDFKPQIRALAGVEPRKPKRKVIGSDAVKIWDDIVIGGNEEVRGSVVTIFGDAVIEGRVDGNVIVILGDLHLTETAEVTEDVYTILGRLDRDEDAQVSGSVVVLDPTMLRETSGLRDLLAGGWVSFLAKQVIFLLVVFLVLILLAVAPRDKFVTAGDALRSGPMSCLAYGLLIAVFGNIALALIFLVLSLTIIGIPIALLLLLAMLLLGLMAVAIVAVQVGRRTCAILGLRCEHQGALAVVGLLVLHSFTLVGSLLGTWQLLGPVALLLSIVGLGIKMLAYFFGLGAIAASRLGTRDSGPVVQQQVA